MNTLRKNRKTITLTLIVLITLGLTGNLYAQRTGSLSGSSSSNSGLAETYQMTFREVAQKTLPVVVEVNTVNIIETQAMPDAFEFFFGRNPDRDNEEQQEPREYRQQGLGSGVIVKDAGSKVYILTNHHVVNGAEEIEVTLNDGREFEAELVGSDPRRDLALIKVETSERVPVAVLGDSDELYVGDWVFAVGNPLGFEASFTAGIVSAVGREADITSQVSFTDYIQTDAAINPGNSGGALVNIRGEVIGINSWIATQSGGSNGLGFAIPINNAKNAIDDFIKSGSVVYGWLGVNVRDISDESKVSLGIEGIDGAFINDVFIDSPADDGGLQAGDFITKVGNQVINDRNDLVKIIGNLPPDKWTSFELYREGRKMSISLRLGQRDDQKNIAADGSINVWPGLTVVEASDEVRESLKLETNKGSVVVANVTKGSPAEAAGLRPGDLILRVDNKRIKSMDDFYSELNDIDNDEVMLRIYRGNREAIIGIVKE
ncbi:MAG: Do family serine endopeptidase [Spirochaetales bacterium]|uniref:Do family serine endopeptidase n=1 Tax=Candidatus Thalassospirochaeta sargassi TaxID=3119039 RepID=A0AAJ1IDY1_9SPIO|nr:Do family serine endopeptidase [Spirochaetales bacterium]